MKARGKLGNDRHLGRLELLLRLRSMAWRVCLVVVFLPQSVAAQTPGASVAGGADVSGKNYSWVVTNDHDAAIVSVEFPHYRGSLFNAPDGWGTACTSLVNVGVADAPGLCKATATSVADGIRPGHKQTFRLRLDATGARRGLGKVRIRFADASEFIVADVEVPQQEGRAEKYMPIFGLVPVLLVAVLIRRKRARSNGAASTT